MAYTTINDPSEYFGAVLYTGNTVNIPVNMNMRPDWFWFKSRTQTYSHLIYDTSRPADGSTMPSGDVNMYNFISADSDADEDDNNADGLVQTSTGFIVDGDGQAIGEANQGANNMVCWAWKANGGTTTTNDASATSVGSIDSVYQANTTAGFSIITYTGTGSAGTIAHGLGATPSVMIVKNRSKSAGESWMVYHHKNTSAPQTDHLQLNTNNATSDNDVAWNDTAPTSTVFSVNNDDSTNDSGETFVGYFFTEIQGYSKFGGYTGNGNANGPFLYTGFKPAWVMIKETGASGSWHIFDNKRKVSNVSDSILYADLNNVEGTSQTGNPIDILSNGFKCRGSGNDTNLDGGTYVYMAFAESPFVTSNGTPNNAR
jgi:hypothetical protein